MQPNHSLCDTAPKITAVVSLGNHLSVASGSDNVLQGANSSPVYAQEGDTYQQLRTIKCEQISSPIGEEQEVLGTSVKVEPTDPEAYLIEIVDTDSNLVEGVDTENVYVEVGDVEPEIDQVKIEYQQLSFGHWQMENDWQLGVHRPEKKLRGYKPP